MPDQASIQKLQYLHPKLRALALQAYQEAVNDTPKGVHPVVTQTYRSFAESDALYQQGRTKPGPKVTNAKAGQSYHNYGLAIDLALEINGKIVWNVDANWMTMINAFKKHGFSWGGDWKSFKDYPHVELTFGHQWPDLLALHNAGKVDAQGYVII
jgi:peptidoglycan L-alanyl-D-glutamate endopeptidase CwlK